MTIMTLRLRPGPNTFATEPADIEVNLESGQATGERSDVTNMLIQSCLKLGYADLRSGSIYPVSLPLTPPMLTAIFASDWNSEDYVDLPPRKEWDPHYVDPSIEYDDDIPRIEPIY